MSHEGLTSPRDYIRELQRADLSLEHLLKTLQSVRVSLTGRPLRYFNSRASGRCRKKSLILWDFQGQITEKTANLVGISLKNDW